MTGLSVNRRSFLLGSAATLASVAAKAVPSSQIVQQAIDPANAYLRRGSFVAISAYSIDEHYGETIEEWIGRDILQRVRARALEEERRILFGSGVGGPHGVLPDFRVYASGGSNKVAVDIATDHGA